MENVTMTAAAIQTAGLPVHRRARARTLPDWIASRQRVSASRRAAADCQRLEGSFSRQRLTTRCNSTGTRGFSRTTDVGALCTIASNIAPVDAPENGIVPVAI